MTCLLLISFAAAPWPALQAHDHGRSGEAILYANKAPVESTAAITEPATGRGLSKGPALPLTLVQRSSEKAFSEPQDPALSTVQMAPPTVAAKLHFRCKTAKDHSFFSYRP